MSSKTQRSYSKPTSTVNVLKNQLADAIEEEAAAKDIGRFSDAEPTSLDVPVPSIEEPVADAVARRPAKKRPIPPEFQGDLSLSKAVTIRTTGKLKGALDLVTRIKKERDPKSRQNDLINEALCNYIITTLTDLGYDTKELEEMRGV